MASLGQSFNARTVPPSSPRDVIPPGKYVMQIVKSERKDTKDGQGEFIEMELDVLDGEFKGRKVWDRLNKWNANPQTVKIAEETLSAICHATGVLDLTDTEQLHCRPMLVKVIVKPERTVNGRTYDPSNEIKGYEALPNAGGYRAPPQQQTMPVNQPQQQAPQPQQQAIPQQTAPAGAATGAAQAGGSKAPPWRRAAG